MAIEPLNRGRRDDPGSAARGGARSVFTSFAGNVAFLVVVAGCGAGVLAWNGRGAGAAGVVAVNVFALLTYLVFRRWFDRVRGTPVEGLVSWLIWTVMIGGATVFYVLDWRVLGALALAGVLLVSFANTYLAVMRPDVVDELVRRRGEGGSDDEDEPFDG
jgi:hypothetical protein